MTNAVLRGCCLMGVVYGLAAQADSETFSVPEGTTYTVDANATHAVNDIRGKLILPKGYTFGATDNWFGRTGEASVDIQGGIYGTKTSTAADNEILVGEEGGCATVSLSDGGTIQGGQVVIKPSVQSDADGFVHFLTSSGNNTVNCLARHNQSAYPVRIEVLSGSLTDRSDSIGYYDARYQSGSWIFDVASGATINFDHQYRMGALNNNATVTVSGDGSVWFRAPAVANAWSVKTGASFSTVGGMDCSGAPVSFANGVVFGDKFGTLSTSVAVSFGGNVNLGSLTVTGSGAFKAASGTAPCVTFGTADRDAVLTGRVFTEDCGLSLVKTGTGSLTASATTPYLPSLALDTGALVIKGALSCAGLTQAAGTTVIVDGGVWTLEGNQLTQAAGTEISVVNGGRLVVKTVDGVSPTFAPGAKIGVSEYWLEGVRQPNGSYTVGGATLEAYDYIEPTGEWTNQGKSGESFSFTPGEEYLGFSLVTEAAPMNFSGGPVTLGPSGMTVTSVTANAYDFGVSLLPAVDQTWSFGSSSATFSAPFVSRGNVSGGRVTVSSDADIVFASTNSTFAGSFAVTARRIEVSGRHALGVGTDASSLSINYKTSGAKIILRDVDLAQDVTLALGSTSTRTYLSFQGTNSLQGCSFGDSTRGGTYEAGSDTVYNGPVSYVNFNSWLFGRDACVVYKGPVSFGGWAGSRSFATAVAASADYGSPKIRFEAQNTIPADNVYYADFSNVRVETAADHVFKQGWIKTSSATTLDLCGFDQCVTRIDGSGKVNSSESAFLELAPAEGVEQSNALSFDGKAGIRMVGAGSVRMTGNYDSEGAIAVTNGCLTLATTCMNVSAVSVTEKGCLVVEEAKPFDREVVSLTLGCVGALAVRSGVPLRVASLTLVNPSTGVSATYTSGDFTAANTFGLISEGMVSVGRSGLILIYR